MSLSVCACCGTRFAVGLEACPHCQATEFKEEGSVPKITKFGGPSIAGEGPPAGFTAEWEPVEDETEDEAAPADPTVTASEEHEHPGTGDEMHEIPASADGTVHEVTGDGSGEALPPIGSGDASSPEPVVDTEAEGDADDNDVAPDAEPAPAVPPRPAVNAAKSEWVAYVAAMTGQSHAEVNLATKADLIEQYGRG